MTRNALLLTPVLLGLAGCAMPGRPAAPATWLLTNRHRPDLTVEAAITANRDCASRGAGFVGRTSFVLPRDATRIMTAPPGADICWRRERNPPRPQWDRAYLRPGQTVDSTL